MPTLLEYFKNDFKDLSIDKPIIITYHTKDENENLGEAQSLEIQECVKQNIDSSVKLFTYYIPEFNDTTGLISYLINIHEERINDINNSLSVFGGYHNDVEAGEHKSIYSNRIYFYTESLLSVEEIIKLDELCKQFGLLITIRSSDYDKTRMELERPSAFISHDSRDKDLIARELANGLNSRLCFVWYDEYSLKIGNSLRESIEDGIKKAKKCILILTKNFLSNPGWGKKEFDSIFTREMIFNEKIVLPIWFGVTRKEVYEYSPSLADTFALTWPSKEGKSDEDYKQEVQQLISKIHTAITS